MISGPTPEPVSASTPPTTPVSEAPEDSHSYDDIVVIIPKDETVTLTLDPDPTSGTVLSSSLLKIILLSGLKHPRDLPSDEESVILGWIEIPENIVVSVKGKLLNNQEIVDLCGVGISGILHEHLQGCVDHG